MKLLWHTSYCQPIKVSGICAKILCQARKVMCILIYPACQPREIMSDQNQYCNTNNMFNEVENDRTIHNNF